MALHWTLLRLAPIALLLWVLPASPALGKHKPGEPPDLPTRDMELPLECPPLLGDMPGIAMRKPPPPPAPLSNPFITPDGGRTGAGTAPIPCATSPLTGASPAPGPVEAHPADLRDENRLTLVIGDVPNAGSVADKIELLLGGVSFNLRADFSRDATLVFDFADASDPSKFETIPPDDWKRIRLRTDSKDGIFVERVTIVHSSETVLDAFPFAWLDEWYGRVLDLSLDSALEKWGQVRFDRTTAVYYAIQDLGQTGYQKYLSADRAWCSEFASWAIRQTGLNTPTGSIGSDDLLDWFDDRDRDFSQDDLLDGDYIPRAGDYLGLDTDGDGAANHSGIFYRWDAVPPTADKPPDLDDQFWSIEGNVNNGVHLVEGRTVGQIIFGGNAQ